MIKRCKWRVCVLHRYPIQVQVDAPEVRLSPTYDLLPTVLLIPEDREEMALTLNGKKRKLKLSDFRQFGLALRLTERQVENSFRRIGQALNFGLDLIGKGACSAENKIRYRDLILERAMRLGWQIDSQ